MPFRMRNAVLIRTGDSRKEKSKTIVKKAATGYQSETAKVQETYDISPIDFSEYSLSETTEKIVDINFTRESTDKHGDYMVCGHFPSTLMCHQFCTKCGFDLTQVDGYSAYAFSDEQMAIFTYCEGDVYFSPYKDKERYEKRKQETILFYKTRSVAECPIHRNYVPHG